MTLPPLRRHSTTPPTPHTHPKTPAHVLLVLGTTHDAHVGELISRLSQGLRTPGEDSEARGRGRQPGRGAERDFAAFAQGGDSVGIGGTSGRGRAATCSPAATKERLGRRTWSSSRSRTRASSLTGGRLSTATRKSRSRSSLRSSSSLFASSAPLPSIAAGSTHPPIPPTRRRLRSTLSFVRPSTASFLPPSRDTSPFPPCRIVGGNDVSESSVIWSPETETKRWVRRFGAGGDGSNGRDEEGKTATVGREERGRRRYDVPDEDTAWTAAGRGYAGGEGRSEWKMGGMEKTSEGGRGDATAAQRRLEAVLAQVCWNG